MEPKRKYLIVFNDEQSKVVYEMMDVNTFIDEVLKEVRSRRLSFDLSCRASFVVPGFDVVFYIVCDGVVASF